MDASELGYINHKPLVWANECARHKLLDVIGDLALIGKPIKGRIIATRPGHTVNNKFARQMRKEIRLHEIQAPTYNCNEAPVMDVNRIRELLPHRYPFQLVDKVIEIGANYIVGVKGVTVNEPFFQDTSQKNLLCPVYCRLRRWRRLEDFLFSTRSMIPIVTLLTS